jgi:hypothetical protein
MALTVTTNTGLHLAQVCILCISEFGVYMYFETLIEKKLLFIETRFLKEYNSKVHAENKSREGEVENLHM